MTVCIVDKLDMSEQKHSETATPITRVLEPQFAPVVRAADINFTAANGTADRSDSYCLI